MSFDEGLAKQVRTLISSEHPLKEKQMFGGLAFMVNGHMCCGIVGEDLVVRTGQTVTMRRSLNLTPGPWILRAALCEASCTLGLEATTLL